MVRDHDRIRPDFHRAACVGGAHYALQHEGAAPLLADRGGGVPVHRRVEHGVEIFGDAHRLVGALADMGVEIGKAELLAKDIIERPARAGGIAPDARRREARRSGEAAPKTALALAGHDGVDRQRQRIELCRLAALDHVGVEPLVLVDVELEQFGAAGERGDFLDAARGEAGDAEPQPESFRCLGHRGLALPVEGALDGGGREHQRQRRAPPEDGAGGVDFLDPGEHVRHQIDPGKGGGVARLGQLVIGRAVDIVEHGEGQAGLRQLPEIVDVVAIGQAHGGDTPARLDGSSRERFYCFSKATEMSSSTSSLTIGMP